MGRNSVHKPDQELHQALEGSIAPDVSAPVGCVTEVKLCRTVLELSQTLQGQAGMAAGLGLLPVPLLRCYRREFLESLHTTVFSVSLVVQARRVLGGLKAPEPRLRGDVAPPTDPVGLDRFVAQHGDCWVRSVQLGDQLRRIRKETSVNSSLRVRVLGLSQSAAKCSWL